MSVHTQDLARIAGDIDRYGIAANETAVTMVAEWARAAAVDPVLVWVLSDVTEPQIARARAFGMIATALAAPGPLRPARHAREHRQRGAMAVV